ncbi:hypothetical protein BUALT_BualtUnG0055200 [Buddleja alternifolia]|uniref:Uncharacterized protein n=1 Tax=Buddleja alternifolia TaxID=168488 RepID=A0AAV6W5X7_9LAMI|nr:hypothetical protein BUALT_BualtUnG0055200 [Buddleja alternifolia]
MPVYSTRSEASIFKVFGDLGSTTGEQTIYDPVIVSIGPYHYGVPHLQGMEGQKTIYLQKLLSRLDEKTIHLMTTTFDAMEEKARACYKHLNSLSSKNFQTMMMLDGCFIIELIRRYGISRLRDEAEAEADPIIGDKLILQKICRDLFLIENQLPFFIMNEIFQLTKTEVDEDDIVSLCLHFVKGMYPNYIGESVMRGSETENINHLLGLLDIHFCHPSSRMSPPDNIGKNKESGEISSISSLLESGIRFKVVDGKTRVTDIKFNNRVLAIPRLTVVDHTEALLQNLVAYESSLPEGNQRVVSDYIFLIRCLIRTQEDVKLLQDYGIIFHLTSDDAEVSLLFNRLGQSLKTSEKFSYYDLFCEVNKQSARHRNKWKAKLHKNYLNNSWSTISCILSCSWSISTRPRTDSI